MRSENKNEKKSVRVLFQIRILEMLLVILPGGRGRGRTPTDSKNPKTNQFPQEYIANGPPKPTPSKPRAAGTGGGVFFDLWVTLCPLQQNLSILSPLPTRAQNYRKIQSRGMQIVAALNLRLFQPSALESFSFFCGELCVYFTLVVMRS